MDFNTLLILRTLCCSTDWVGPLFCSYAGRTEKPGSGKCEPYSGAPSTFLLPDYSWKRRLSANAYNLPRWAQKKLENYL